MLQVDSGTEPVPPTSAPVTGARASDYSFLSSKQTFLPARLRTSTAVVFLLVRTLV